MTDSRVNNGIMMAAAAAVAFVIAMFLVPGVAHAETIDQLKAAYADALRGYEVALDEQDENAEEIYSTDQEIKETELQRKRLQNELDEIVVTLYKDTWNKNVLTDLLLKSESFQDAVIRYDLYEKVERRCAERASELKQQCDELNTKMIVLETKKAQIRTKVEQAKKEVDEAEKAMRKAVHVDGDKYHQVQGNGSNCGATAFIVGVNILLDENRYKDNVKVWKGAGFNGDSTNNLAARAKKWLKSNDLSDEIDVEEVEGDIHDADELKELLLEGNVVVISSGSGSPWRYADKPNKAEHNYPDGHWVVFYYYDEDEGVFYSNDSGVTKKRGAGCPYTDKQMQAWLDGRGNHFATVLSAK